MKITREFLKRMINEELNTVLNKKKKLKEVSDNEYGYDEGDEYELPPQPSFQEETDIAVEKILDAVAHLQNTGKGSPQLIKLLQKIASDLESVPPTRLP
jgi:hypothetical protein